ncbi:unnamed protein product [Eretmochelys imbricata]
MAPGAKLGPDSNPLPLSQPQAEARRAQHKAQIRRGLLGRWPFKGKPRPLPRKWKLPRSQAGGRRKWGERRTWGGKRRRRPPPGHREQALIRLCFCTDPCWVAGTASQRVTSDSWGQGRKPGDLSTGQWISLQVPVKAACKEVLYRHG